MADSSAQRIVQWQTNFATATSVIEQRASEIDAIYAEIMSIKDHILRNGRRGGQFVKPASAVVEGTLDECIQQCKSDPKCVAVSRIADVADTKADTCRMLRDTTDVLWTAAYATYAKDKSAFPRKSTVARYVRVTRSDGTRRALQVSTLVAFDEFGRRISDAIPTLSEQHGNVADFGPQMVMSSDPGYAQTTASDSAMIQLDLKIERKVSQVYIVGRDGILGGPSPDALPLRGCTVTLTDGNDRMTFQTSIADDRPEHIVVTPAKACGPADGAGTCADTQCCNSVTMTCGTSKADCDAQRMSAYHGPRAPLAPGDQKMLIYVASDLGDRVWKSSTSDSLVHAAKIPGEIPARLQNVLNGQTVLSGGAAASIEFPMQFTNEYTIMYVAKYASAASRGRMFRSSRPDQTWLSGFWQGNAGVAYRDGKWLAPTRAVPADSWVLGVDTSYVVRFNGVEIARSVSPWSAPSSITLNKSGFVENSEWMCAYVALFNYALSDADLEAIEIQLMSTYGRERFMPPKNVATVLQDPAPQSQRLDLGARTGLVALYTADTLMQGGLPVQANAATYWTDESGNGNHAVINGTVTGDRFEAAGALRAYVAGSAATSVRFPFALKNYTIVYVAGYPSKSTQRRTILRSSKREDAWISGFWEGQIGVAAHGYWLTERRTAPFLTSDNNVIIGVDTPTGYRVNARDVSLDVTGGVPSSPSQLVINIPGDAWNSDWVCAMLMVYDRVLSLWEIVTIENALRDMYAPLVGSIPVNKVISTCDSKNVTASCESGGISTGSAIRYGVWNNGACSVPACPLPNGWCTHAGATLRTTDCLGDGIAGDYVCEEGKNRGTILRSDNCAAIWPNATGCVSASSRFVSSKISSDAIGKRTYEVVPPQDASPGRKQLDVAYGCDPSPVALQPMSKAATDLQYVQAPYYLEPSAVGDLFSQNGTLSQCQVACDLTSGCIGFVRDTVPSDVVSECRFVRTGATVRRRSNQVPAGKTTFVQKKYDIPPDTHEILANIQSTRPYAAFFGDTYDASTRTWLDVSINADGNSYNMRDARTEGSIAVDVIGDKLTLRGTPSSRVYFPTPPSDYTLVYVAKYAGRDRQAIFQSPGQPWISGFFQGASGYAAHGPDPLHKQTSDSAWLLATDMRKRFRVNGRDNTNTSAIDTFLRPQAITINGADSMYGYSHWACACVLIYDRELSDAEVTLVETELIKAHYAANFSDIGKIVGYAYWDAGPRSAAYRSLGCFKDTSDRALPLYLANVQSVDECSQLAQQKRLPYFAVQNGEACFGSPDAQHAKYGALPPDQCGMPCSKTGKGECGGPWANNVFVAQGNAALTRCSAARCTVMTNADSAVTSGTTKLAIEAGGLTLSQNGNVQWTSGTRGTQRVDVIRDVQRGTMSILHAVDDTDVVARQVFSVSPQVQSTFVAPFAFQIDGNRVWLIDSNSARITDITTVPVVSNATAACSSTRCVLARLGDPAIVSRSRRAGDAFHENEFNASVSESEGLVLRLRVIRIADQAEVSSSTIWSSKAPSGTARIAIERGDSWNLVHEATDGSVLRKDPLSVPIAQDVASSKLAVKAGALVIIDGSGRSMPLDASTVKTDTSDNGTIWPPVAWIVFTRSGEYYALPFVEVWRAVREDVPALQKGSAHAMRARVEGLATDLPVSARIALSGLNTPWNNSYAFVRADVVDMEGTYDDAVSAPDADVRHVLIDAVGSPLRTIVVTESARTTVLSILRDLVLYTDAWTSVDVSGLPSSIKTVGGEEIAYEIFPGRDCYSTTSDMGRMVQTTDPLSVAVECLKTPGCTGFVSAAGQRGVPDWTLLNRVSDTGPRPNRSTRCYAVNAIETFVSTRHGPEATPLETPSIPCRYVTLMRYDDNAQFINVSNITVFDQNGALIQDNVTTCLYPQHESSVDFGPQRLGAAGAYAHTGAKTDAFVRLDLGGTRRVSKVVVDNRADCCMDRMIGTCIVLTAAADSSDRSAIWVRSITDQQKQYSMSATEFRNFPEMPQYLGRRWYSALPARYVSFRRTRGDEALRIGNVTVYDENGDSMQWGPNVQAWLWPPAAEPNRGAGNLLAQNGWAETAKHPEAYAMIDLQTERLISRVRISDSGYPLRDVTMFLTNSGGSYAYSARLPAAASATIDVHAMRAGPREKGGRQVGCYKDNRVGRLLEQTCPSVEHCLFLGRSQRFPFVAMRGAACLGMTADDMGAMPSQNPAGCKTVAACPLPDNWCRHAGSTLQATDCLGDGIAGDYVCTDTAGNRGTILRSDNCGSLWPNASGCKSVSASEHLAVYRSGFTGDPRAKPWLRSVMPVSQMVSDNRPVDTVRIVGYLQAAGSSLPLLVLVDSNSVNDYFVLPVACVIRLFAISPQLTNDKCMELCRFYAVPFKQLSMSVAVLPPLVELTWSDLDVYTLSRDAPFIDTAKSYAFIRVDSKDPMSVCLDAISLLSFPSDACAQAALFAIVKGLFLKSWVLPGTRVPIRDTKGKLLAFHVYAATYATNEIALLDTPIPRTASPEDIGATFRKGALRIDLLNATPPDGFLMDANGDWSLFVYSPSVGSTTFTMGNGSESYFHFPSLANIATGLAGLYLPESIDLDAGVWRDLSGNSRDARISAPCVMTYSARYNMRAIVTGISSSQVELPHDFSGAFTLVHLTRYSGPQRDLVVSDSTGDWFSGFADGASGRAKHGNAIFDANPATVRNTDDWVLSVDTQRTYRANMTSSDPKGNATQPQGGKLGINVVNDGGRRSDWSCALVMVYDRELTPREIADLETFVFETIVDLLVPVPEDPLVACSLVKASKDVEAKCAELGVGKQDRVDYYRAVYSDAYDNSKNYTINLAMNAASGGKTEKVDVEQAIESAAVLAVDMAIGFVPIVGDVLSIAVNVASGARWDQRAKPILHHRMAEAAMMADGYSTRAECLKQTEERLVKMLSGRTYLVAMRSALASASLMRYLVYNMHTARVIDRNDPQDVFSRMHGIMQAAPVSGKGRADVVVATITGLVVSKSVDLATAIAMNSKNMVQTLALYFEGLRQARRARAYRPATIEWLDTPVPKVATGPGADKIEADYLDGVFSRGNSEVQNPSFKIDSLRRSSSDLGDGVRVVGDDLDGIDIAFVDPPSRQASGVVSRQVSAVPFTDINKQLDEGAELLNVLNTGDTRIAAYVASDPSDTTKTAVASLGFVRPDDIKLTLPDCCTWPSLIDYDDAAGSTSIKPAAQSDAVSTDTPKQGTLGKLSNKITPDEIRQETRLLIESQNASRNKQVTEMAMDSALEPSSTKATAQSVVSPAPDGPVNPSNFEPKPPVVPKLKPNEVAKVEVNRLVKIINDPSKSSAAMETALKKLNLLYKNYIDASTIPDLERKISVAKASEASKSAKAQSTSTTLDRPKKTVTFGTNQIRFFDVVNEDAAKVKPKRAVVVAKQIPVEEAVKGLLEVNVNTTADIATTVADAAARPGNIPRSITVPSVRGPFNASASVLSSKDASLGQASLPQANALNRKPAEGVIQAWKDAKPVDSGKKAVTTLPEPKVTSAIDMQSAVVDKAFTRGLLPPRNRLVRTMSAINKAELQKVSAKSGSALGRSLSMGAKLDPRELTAMSTFAKTISKAV